MTFGKFSIALVLYTALSFGANADLASDGIPQDWVNYKTHEAPVAVSDTIFIAPDGSDVTLADLSGKVTLVNFWATWCAPCRAEMPSLDSLSKTLGGEDFQVVTIAAGRNPAALIDRFFKQVEIEALTRHLDPKMDLAKDMGVTGLPVTVLLNAEGQEIARLTGDADWASDEALAYFQRVIDQSTLATQ